MFLSAVVRGRCIQLPPREELWTCKQEKRRHDVRNAGTVTESMWMCFDFLLSIKTRFILLKSLPPFLFNAKSKLPIQSWNRTCLQTPTRQERGDSLHSHSSLLPPSCNRQKHPGAMPCLRQDDPCESGRNPCHLCAVKTLPSGMAKVSR